MWLRKDREEREKEIEPLLRAAKILMLIGFILAAGFVIAALVVFIRECIHG